MYFDARQKWHEIRRKFAAEAEIMRAAGVPEHCIRTLWRITLSEYNSDRRFYALIHGGEDTLRHTGGCAEPLPDFMDEIEDQRLFRALRSLTAKEREIVILHVLAGYTLREAAALLGLTYAAVQQKYFRAKKNIFKKMSDLPPPECLVSRG